MSNPRYLVIFGSRDPFGKRHAIEERANILGLKQIYTASGVSLFSDASHPILLAENKGVIIGRVFRRGEEMPDFAPAGTAESGFVAETLGQYLIDNCWGNYIAVLSNAPRDCAVLIRPPFSDLGCLHTVHHGILVAGSDLGVLRDCLNLAWQPNWKAIAGHLLTRGLREDRTCVDQVRELLWGMRLVCSIARTTVEPCWDPWSFAAARRKGPAEDLAVQLQDIAMKAIAAQVRGLRRVAVMLSGGLDSSILSACVSATEARLICLNLTTGDSFGNERTYAQTVARALGAEYGEASLRLDNVDIAHSEAIGLARPVSRSLSQASHSAKQRLAAAFGAQVIFDGGGGDNLFCSLQSVAPVTDQILENGPGFGAWTTAVNIAQLTEASIVTVFGRGLRRALFRRHGFRWPLDSRFLSNDAILMAGDSANRWLVAPRNSFPGSAAHIGLMVAVESLLESSNRGILERSPLVVQPIVEMCLSIPTWSWYERGNNRAIARRAFSHILPEGIAWRRYKGSPDGFVTEIFETNRGRIQEFLLDGKLAESGLLNIPAIKDMLQQRGPVKGHDHIRLLGIVDVEAWLRTL